MILYSLTYLNFDSRQIMKQRFQFLDFLILFIFSFPSMGAVDFERQVLPILQERCIECHKGPYELNGKLKEPKAGLRLDGATHIMLGGDAGPVVVANYPSKSSLYQRVILPVDDSEHMPPRGDPLTENQKDIFRKWIAQGLDFGRWVGNTEGVAELTKKKNSEVPVYVPKHIRFYSNLSDGLEQLSLSKIKQISSETNLMIRPIGIGNPLIEARLVTASESVGDREVQLLLPLASHLVKLDLRNSKISDDSCLIIRKFSRLVELNLFGTEIGDSGMRKLEGLKHLQILNICKTNVSNKGIEKIKELKSLQKIYLWESRVSDEMQSELAKELSRR